MKEIYFIRHGETSWNKKGLSQGSRNDIKLNKNGIIQAKKTGKYLNKYRQRDTKFDLIISSPMLRTKKTAEIIAKQIGYDNYIIYYDELKERDQGLVSIGKTNEELKKDSFYDDYFDILNQHKQIKDPVEKILFDTKNKDIIDKTLKKYEMESFDDIIVRVKKVLDISKNNNHKKIIVVTHGGFINAINKYLLNTFASINDDLTNGSNCHITTYVYDHDIYKLVMPPNTLHLAL